FWVETLETVVIDVRLPRILGAILVGGALAVSGASYQTMFKNPMVSPDLLGVSAGASFGAALVMLNKGSQFEIQLTAFIFGIMAVAAAYIIARIIGKNSLTVLVLAGVVISSFFQSLLSIVKTLADTDNALPSITFWLMGSLGKINNADVAVIVLMMAVSMLLLFLFRHQIDAMAAGEAEAATMGVNVPLVKLVVVFCSTIMTVCSVSACGVIGWIGLVVPHIARSFVGASYGKLMASSFLIGGLFLLLVDNLIRGASAVNLPLGVLTALIGTPAFVAVLAKTRKEWH
ncbi:MAG: iron ABC transporter permease, partial [Oscillospiraceae bacterium]|nr:iron ABC transporter permease [Oscillospiraceae bacterium]